MVAKTHKNVSRAYEMEEGSGKLGKVLIAVLLYCMTLLLGYVVLAAPKPGSGLEIIRRVLCGLGGSVALAIPGIFAWLGTLVAMSAAGKRVSVWKSIIDSVLFLCLFTAAQLFVTEHINRNIMTIHLFPNFVKQSYLYGKGGGAIGALLAYPLYNGLDFGGGLITVAILAIISLTATGKSVRFCIWCMDGFDEMKHSADQRRMERENKHMFDVNSFGGEDIPGSGGKGPNPGRNPGGRNPGSGQNPGSGRNPGGQNPGFGRNPGGQNPNPGRNPGKSKAPHRNEVYVDDNDDLRMDERTAYDDEPSMKPFEKKPGKKGKKQEKKDDVIYVDPQATLPPPEEEEPVDFFDDIPDPVPVTPAKPAKKPRHAAQKAEPAHAPAPVPADDDLTIEPEACDVLQDDEPPFDMPAKSAQPSKKLKRTPVPAEPEEEAYNYPPIDILEPGDGIQENHRENDLRKAQLLESTLKEFGISTKLTGIAHGPAVTRFELQPAPGVKVSRITGLADDIAMHLEAMSVRIEAPIPGKAAVGVEIPNDKIEMVRLRDVLESPEARKLSSKLAVCLGKDNAGRYIVADIAKMPHVLIAGQTGSGKSVCINSIITSILYRATPDEVRLILIDPKMVELSIYNDIPHLVCPVVTDCKKAASALDWAVAEMSMRYKRFSERGVRNIKGYNAALKEGEKPMPQMVIIIDELADLMMVAPGEVEDSICRLAQLARAAGMHLVIATQRPSVNVITGIIKANIPSRIAFSVSSQVDSRTIIDHGGAEKLLGNGDMLFVPSGINKPMRVQGAWVSDEEVNAITDYIKARSETSYDADMIEKMDNAARTDAEKEEFNAEYDPRLPEAVEIVVEAGQASVSMLQRRMRVGYARAGRLIDEMEQRGIVSPADGAKVRSVLITREEMEEMFEE